MSQYVITVRAQEVYSSVSSSECLGYASVKSAVLEAYELDPEAYPQQLRTWRRSDRSHMEFAHDLI